MNYLADIILCIIAACVLIGLAFYWFWKKYVYKMKCELWVKKKKMNGKSEKCLGIAEKRVLAKSAKQAKAKMEKELKEEIEKRLRRRFPKFRLDKIPNYHYFIFFVNGKQF